MLGIYLLGCGWMTFRFFRQLYRVSALIRSGKKTRFREFTLVESHRVSTPFSFLGFLFWNPNHDYDPTEWQTVRAHEYAHIRQGHSVDLLLLEIIGIFCWWCPFWYGYNRALRNVHEYLADAVVIRQTPTREYGQLLIRQCLSQPAPALAHGLRHHSQLKNRIAMMTKSNSSRMALAKYVTLLPLLAVLTVACSQTEPVEVTQAQVEKYKPVGQVVDTVITFYPDTYEEQVKYVPSDLYKEVEQMPVFGSCPGLKGEELEKCSNTNLMKFLVANMTYPPEAKKSKVEGMVVASFVIFPNGSVGNVQIKKSVSPECDAEVVRLVRAMPDWQPGFHDGKAVNVEFSLPVKFKLN
ncbi:MAG: M56 family metallopeptidase [Saprospirales bacterium]|nr:M56 family metallopeptidase [Saprospirales bacterium]